MLDFTSALYLGLRHSSAELAPWEQFTLGKPAALESPPGAEFVARRLADLQGCEGAALGPSTLHLFCDLFEWMARQDTVIFMDAGAYPVARCGAERAAARGVAIRSFPHHGVGALRRAARACGTRKRPVVVVDGFCPGCGRSAPVGEFLEVVRSLGGWLVVDDSQGLGVLGERPNGAMPYGFGGGGTPSLLGVRGPELIVVSSLAKGFGAPIAVLSGSRRFVDAFKATAATREHCSPPSIPAITAAARALEINARHGDALRRRLLSLVRRLRRSLQEIGLAPPIGVFPMQTLRPTPGLDAAALRAALWRRGIATVLLRPRGAPRTDISVLLTARHSPADIDRLVAAVAPYVRPARPRLLGRRSSALALDS